MNKIAKLFVTGAAIVTAALCFQSCEKMSERENKLMLARENTFLGNRSILSFYCNDKLCFDTDTWYLYIKHILNFFLPNTYYSHDRERLIIGSSIHCSDSPDTQIGYIEIKVPIENGELCAEKATLIDLHILHHGAEVVGSPNIPINLVIEEYETGHENRHISGRFSFHLSSSLVEWFYETPPISVEELQANGNVHPEPEPCHDVPDISVQNGLFNIRDL